MKKDILREMFSKNGFKFFKRGIYNLNVFGVRSTNSDLNKFDDIICVACKTELGWLTFAMNATTSPGSNVLGEHMGSHNGTAILPAMKQYPFKVCRHRDKYSSLVQADKFDIIRDSEKDDLLSSDGDSVSGWFGINIHHASSTGVSPKIENWSWGCQVVQSIHDWKKFWSIVERGVESFGSGVTYTLFDEDELGMSISEFSESMNRL